MDSFESDLFGATTYFFNVLVAHFLKAEEREHEEAQKGILGKIDFKSVLDQYSSIHPLVFESQAVLNSFPEKSGDYKTLLIVLKKSMSLFMELLENKIYYFNRLYNKSLGNSFSFKDFRKLDKTIKKLRKKMAAQLYSLEVIFSLFNKRYNQ